MSIPQGRTVRRALVVRAFYEKLAILDPFVPMAKLTATTTVFPYTGLVTFLFGKWGYVSH